MPRLASDLEDRAGGEVDAWMSPVVLERGSDDVGVLDRHVLVVEKHLDGCDDRSRGKAVDGAQDPGRLRQHEVTDPPAGRHEGLGGRRLPGIVARDEANEDVRVNGPHAASARGAGYPS